LYCCQFIGLRLRKLSHINDVEAIFCFYQSINNSSSICTESGIGKLFNKVFPGKPSQVPASLSSTVLTILLSGYSKVTAGLNFLKDLLGLGSDLLFRRIIQSLGAQQNVACSHPRRSIITI